MRLSVTESLVFLLCDHFVICRYNVRFPISVTEIITEILPVQPFEA